MQVRSAATRARSPGLPSQVREAMQPVLATSRHPSPSTRTERPKAPQ